jgi:hypothetical protein
MAVSVAVETKEALDKLWGATSIWGVFKQEELAALIAHESVHRNSPLPALVDLMIHRWQEYNDVMSQLQWTYGGALGFFMSGRWDNPEKWPWKAGRAAVGVYRAAPEEAKPTTEAWINEWRAKNKMALL